MTLAWFASSALPNVSVAKTHRRLLAAMRRQARTQTCKPDGPSRRPESNPEEVIYARKNSQEDDAGERTGISVVATGTDRQSPMVFPPSPELGKQLQHLQEAQAEIDRRKVDELARLREIQDRD